jgi:lipoprotein-anchoring transpeptidase ErfK/SrfK
MTGMRLVSVITAMVLALAGCTTSGGELQPSGVSETTARGEISTAESQVMVTDDTDTRRSASKVRRFADLSHGVTTKSSKLKVRERPTRSSPWHKMGMTNPIGQRLVLLIRKARSTAHGDWFEVLLPERPNRSTAWVKRRDVRVVSLRHRIEVDLSRYTLKHFRNDELVRRFKVGVGQDRYPTPKGVYYVWAKVPQPSSTGPYGNYALGISGFSPVLSDWPGGGRAAVHGTAVARDRGQKVSHGCVRVFNDDMRKIKGVPLGTPVVITR